ncbi:MAG TPA: ribonuclease H family protein [Bacteroidales bacterium]|nr:ribonuclease H family protein [Bacteroidales bacterium]HPT03228.1 ribonuclease H family protein [Bacteroidales bacterium]
MKKKIRKYYVVWRGRKPGIYDNWEECRKQVEGFPEARYAGFETPEEARAALKGNPQDYFKRKPGGIPTRPMNSLYGVPEKESICVDAACSGNPGVLEYRGVYTATGEEIFHRGPFPEGTTNIGEFLAIVTGLAWLKLHRLTIPLYSDSRNGLKWVKQKKINTTLERDAGTEKLFQTVDKALAWLHENGYDNKLLKWETEAWGEIPADFGRK